VTDELEAEVKKVLKKFLKTGVVTNTGLSRPQLLALKQLTASLVSLSKLLRTW